MICELVLMPYKAGHRLELQAAFPKICAAYREYVENASDFNFHLIAPLCNGVDDADLVSGLQNNYAFLQGKGRALRPLYDRILNAPQFGICPYCGARRVSSIDHFLPKERFGVFSVFAVNLVPACSDCNNKEAQLYSNKR